MDWLYWDGEDEWSGYAGNGSISRLVWSCWNSKMAFKRAFKYLWNTRAHTRPRVHLHSPAAPWETWFLSWLSVSLLLTSPGWNQIVFKMDFYPPFCSPLRPAGVSTNHSHLSSVPVWTTESKHDEKIIGNKIHPLLGFRGPQEGSL